MSPANQNLSTDLIEVTLRHLREHATSLEEEKAHVEQKISEVSGNIQRWERELRNGGQAKAGTEHTKNVRRKKGENSQLVRKCFDEHPGGSLTIPQISEITNLSHSSVHSIVKRESGIYEHVEEGNKWRIKENNNALS